MKKKAKIIFISILSIILIIAAAFFIYVSDYYKTDRNTKNRMESAITKGEVTESGRFMIFHAGEDNGSALIFYPGGKVESSAYFPLLSKIADKGITCVLVKMPFHLAVFDPSAANQIYNKLPQIKKWYIGGHSLGGAMAGSYMSKNQDKLKGLILLGSYIYGDIDPQKALTIYGSRDNVLNRNKITYDKNIVIIEGGNHANYGNYGKQKGDGTASISRGTQQNEAVAAIIKFMSEQ
jgi:hypothetical protein